MSFVGKEYKLEKQENYEEFLNSLGSSLSPEIKNVVLNFKPVVKLTKNGDSYTLSTKKPDGGTQDVTFKLGEEVEESIFGRNSKSVFTLDGNVLTQVQKVEGGVFTFKREFSDTKLVTTMTASHWDGKCVRYFTAV